MNLACVDAVGFNIVDTSVLRTYSKGDAKLAMDNLRDKFKPEDGLTKVELKKEYNSSTLKSLDEDPDKWITELIQIQSKISKIGHKIDDEGLMPEVICNLPQEYDTVVEICIMRRGNCQRNANGQKY